jgi:hypothetical protein
MLGGRVLGGRVLAGCAPASTVVGREVRVVRLVARGVHGPGIADRAWAAGRADHWRRPDGRDGGGEACGRNGHGGRAEYYLGRSLGQIPGTGSAFVGETVGGIGEKLRACETGD